MQPLILVSAAGQVAAYLRGEVERGHWTENMPGVGWLAAELGVNHKTVEAALRLLQNEGLLENQGVGRKRRIVPSETGVAHPLRIAILTGMKVAGIRRLVARTAVDAWVIIAGSREVLEWFVEQQIPAFALFGRRDGLPIAGVGPDKLTTVTSAARCLIGLGHRRIVLLSRTERRLPEPGNSERAFLDELNAHGIATGAFNLPEWKDSAEGFHGCLEALFGLTPPSALIVDEAPFFVAAQQFLGRHRLRVPEDVSLVCTDGDRAFSWCKPAVSHIRWDTRPVLRRIVRWTNNLGRGKRDLRQTLTPAEFVPGGTIGPLNPVRLVDTAKEWKNGGGQDARTTGAPASCPEPPLAKPGATCSSGL